MVGWLLARLVDFATPKRWSVMPTDTPVPRILDLRWLDPREFGIVFIQDDDRRIRLMDFCSDGSAFRCSSRCLHFRQKSRAAVSLLKKKKILQFRG
jgi:hypothetical protein